MGLRKVTLNLQELIYPVLKAISLVDKPANRAPFKIIKSEGEDVKIIEKLMGKPPAQVQKGEVVGIAFPIDKKDKVVEFLKKHNLTLSEEVQIDDTHLLLRKSEAAMQDSATPFSLSIDAVVFIKAASLFEKAEQKSFADEMARESIYPLFHVAQSVLSDKIGMMYYSNTKKDELLSSVEMVLNEYHAYVVELFQKLPDYMFEMGEVMQMSEMTKESVDEQIKGAMVALEKAFNDKMATAITSLETAISGLKTSGVELAKAEAKSEVKSEVDPVKSELTDALASMQTLKDTMTQLQKSMDSLVVASAKQDPASTPAAAQKVDKWAGVLFE